MDAPTQTQLGVSIIIFLVLSSHLFLSADCILEQSFQHEPGTVPRSSLTNSHSPHADLALCIHISPSHRAISSQSSCQHFWSSNLGRLCPSPSELQSLLGHLVNCWRHTNRVGFCQISKYLKGVTWRPIPELSESAQEWANFHCLQLWNDSYINYIKVSK